MEYGLMEPLLLAFGGKMQAAGSGRTPASFPSQVLAFKYEESSSLYAIGFVPSSDIMSKAIHELLRKDHVAASHALSDIRGGFPVDGAVLEGN